MTESKAESLICRKLGWINNIVAKAVFATMPIGGKKYLKKHAVVCCHISSGRRRLGAQ